MPRQLTLVDSDIENVFRLVDLHVSKELLYDLRSYISQCARRLFTYSPYDVTVSSFPAPGTTIKLHGEFTASIILYNVL